VFARFSAKVYSGHQITNPAGLLVRMATFLRADFLERRRDGEAPLGDWDDAADDPAFDAITDEDAVDELLAPLNQRQRNAVWGRHRRGTVERRGCAMLDTTPGNIDVMVHRAAGEDAAGVAVSDRAVELFERFVEQRASGGRTDVAELVAEAGDQGEVLAAMIASSWRRGQPPSRTRPR